MVSEYNVTFSKVVPIISHLQTPAVVTKPSAYAKGTWCVQSSVPATELLLALHQDGQECEEHLLPDLHQGQIEHTRNQDVPEVNSE